MLVFKELKISQLILCTGVVFLKEQNLLIYYWLNDTQTYINEYNNRGFGCLERTDF